MYEPDRGGVFQGRSKTFWILVVLGLLILMAMIFGQESDEEKAQDAANLSAAKTLLLSTYTSTPAFAILQPDPNTGFWFYADPAPECNHGMLSYRVDVLPLGATGTKSISMSWCLDLSKKVVEPIDTEARTYWAPINAVNQEDEREAPPQNGRSY
jgi:hypothetical protein